jgi:hypothetical protein
MSDMRVTYEELKFSYEKKCYKTTGMKLMRNKKTSAQVKLFCLSPTHDKGKSHLPHERLR